MLAASAPVAATLRDGTPVRLRPLTDGTDREADKVALSEAFAALSPESRYERFLSPVKALSPQMLHRLVDHVDGTDHAAYVLETAVDDGEPQGLGIGRYVREARQPDRAEIAVTVGDAWQGRGVGGLLAAALADRAREVGIGSFTATVLTGNTASLRMLASVGRFVRRDLTYNGTLEVVLELFTPEERAALRGAAADRP